MAGHGPTYVQVRPSLSTGGGRARRARHRFRLFCGRVLRIEWRPLATTKAEPSSLEDNRRAGGPEGVSTR